MQELVLGNGHVRRSEVAERDCQDGNGEHRISWWVGTCLGRRRGGHEHVNGEKPKGHGV